MAKYLLDTNHASPLVTTGHPLRARFKEHLESGDKFFIAAPALTELWFGFLHTPRSHANRAEWEQLETVVSIRRRRGWSATRTLAIGGWFR